MNSEFKAGQKVIFTGASEDQIKWGRNDDPNKVQALHEVHEKNEANRKEMQESLNRALSDGFRCM